MPTSKQRNLLRLSQSARNWVPLLESTLVPVPMQSYQYVSADPADGKGESVREDITISQGQERSKLQEPERGKQTKEERKEQEQPSKAEQKS